MISKYDGKCNVTKLPIVAGVTEIEKNGSGWMICVDTLPEPYKKSITEWSGRLYVVYSNGKGANINVWQIAACQQAAERQGLTVEFYAPSENAEPRLEHRPEEQAAQLSVRRESFKREDNDLDEQFWQRDA